MTRLRSHVCPDAADLLPPRWVKCVLHFITTIPPAPSLRFLIVTVVPCTVVRPGRPTRFKPRDHTFAEVHQEALRIWEDLETYKALHGTTHSTINAATKTNTGNTQTNSASSTTRTRFNTGDAVYRIVNGRAQKGYIQAIGRVNGIATPTVKWNNADKVENVAFNALKKDERPAPAVSNTTKPAALKNDKGPAPMELDGKGLSGVVCHICQGKGHFARVCPSKNISGNEAQVVEVESEEESGKGEAETA
ncbi:hypothetical protein B0J17DRAFT_767774 [Rhizoctonia solani]|nr:hypothetical protein B0J17DRAFT_767774 [Rhizoctonia solani]